MKKNIITVMAIAFGLTAFAQVKPGVGIGTKKPEKSAILDVSADNKGVLIPRVNLPGLTENALTTYGLYGGVGVQGMLVYNNTGVAEIPVGFYQWNGTQWERIISEVEFTTVIEKIQKDIADSNETVIDGDTKPIGPDGTTPVDPTPGEGGDTEQGGNTEGKYLNVVYRDGKIYYIKKDGEGKNVPYEINLENLIKLAQLKTQIGTVSFNGDEMKVAVNKDAPLKADLEKAGAFYYEFTSEEINRDTGEQVKHYINLGADVATIIKEALNGKDGNAGEDGEDGETIDISKVIKDAIDSYLNGKNNVYYDEIEAGKGKVLYEIVKEGDVDVKKPIDITASVRDVFHKIIKEGDSTFNEIIKEAAGDQVVIGGDAVFTGDYVGGKKVYKSLTEVTVVDGYDSVFEGVVKAPKYQNILNVSVYDVNGLVVVNSVTDVVKVGADEITFAFGAGNMYTPLVEGTYSVLLEYVSTEEKATTTGDGK